MIATSANRFTMHSLASFEEPGNSLSKAAPIRTIGCGCPRLTGVVDESVATDYMGHDPAYPAPIEGPDGLRNWLMTARTAFPDFHIAIEDLIEEDDRVARRITMTGTNTGKLMGMPATSRSVSCGGMFFRRLRDGRFVEGWDIADMATLMGQLGLGPQSAEEPAAASG